MARTPLTACITLLATVIATITDAAAVTHNFNVSWVTANPDGRAERQVIGINGQWPLPVIEVNKGDRLIVNMHNDLGDKNASIHWHGMYQNGTNSMDGASMVTQGPVPPGYDFTYNFTVDQNGTYWYHCHVDFCYPDGYRQAFIVHDKDAYFLDEVEEDLTITMSDWYHELTEELAPSFLSLYNPTGAEPIPGSFLFNDTFNTSIPVKPNKTYLLRVINLGAFVAQYFYIENHTLTIVEIDGVYTEPTQAEIIYVSVAQRYAVLVTTKNSTEKNFPIVTIADSTLLDTIPPDLRLNNTNWLEYNSAAEHPQADITVSQSSDLVPFDDLTLIPYDRMPLLTNPDLTLNLTMSLGDLENGLNYAFIDDISYTAAKVPTLYTVMSSGNLSSDSKIYGDFTHSMILQHNQVVEIILNNDDTGSHPFHLHGHNFQLIDRYPALNGPNFYSLESAPAGVVYTGNTSAMPTYPTRRDTFVLPPQGYWVIRFVADNPGVWFFHCHIDWHLSQGLGMLMIEAPEILQTQKSSIPQQHFDVAKAAGVGIQGNAAGNTEDFLDLDGQNVQQGNIAAGFTTRGFVAMVFSCLNAVLGLVAISVYGFLEPKRKKDLGWHRAGEVVDRGEENRGVLGGGGKAGETEGEGKKVSHPGVQRLQSAEISE
ncbi:Iron transport multicopper oxidase FET3 [Pseudocercospora fuligena]|uniref:Iron transport multicopper oxidase FET3 n=1 Tax=Pseudocercospora fuligena TaxID=685502 RepID=A0A8H6RBQ4_9PEZI|nr:Iron transport multicopper oxidase FET3 [Pseudocercospora fuligena]